ncbi:uncharacterized protein BO66DRAFT_448950 [Aspergillus aculeatinus CBS 121060]|uniref:Uncharacterized protein n=1 Tax=Aspergillus aculeatinus CBS 121060 TaxID=1448322 RepID=A0ACD1HC82_9EURO|nr:hypothetical protein BO66DRAFT_448950 [Aspergillus aculeatinus CBS 121060]RAH71117.1 hypothetical protein BO66DRAFT_448950 [Aspergillus aculeatinus CBS 121060]
MPKRKVPTSSNAEVPSKKKATDPAAVSLSNLGNMIMEKAEMSSTSNQQDPPELTIDCGQYAYSVSLARACSNSAFIEREYGSGSKTTSCTLVLQDDRRVVEHMVKYLHWGESYRYHGKQPFDDAMFKKRKLATKSRMDTQSKNMGTQSKSLAPSAGRDLSFVVIPFFIQLYALATHLEADGLREICKGVIMRALSVDMDRASLMRAIKEVYTRFDESDQMLQEMVVAVVRNNLSLLQAHTGEGGRKSTLKDVLDATASFCRDLSLELSNAPPQHDKNDAIDNDDDEDDGDNGEVDGNYEDDPNDEDWTP